MSIFEPKHDYDFMGMRRYFIGGSLTLMLLTVVMLFKPGPRLGTDFVGGTEVEVAFSKPVEAGQLRQEVDRLGFPDPDVVQVADAKRPHRFLVRVKEVSALTDEQKQRMSALFCLVAEDPGAAKLDPAKCPEKWRTSDVSFSPGGDKVTVRYEQSPCQTVAGEGRCVPRDDLREQLAGIKGLGVELRSGANNPLVQNARDHKVEFYFKSKGDQIMDGLLASLGKDTVPVSAETGAPLPMRVEWIGPKAGRQLRDAAITSVLISLLFMMAYIAFRFDFRFAPGAIIALIHDVTLALGMMVLFKREVTLSTVAALLTIVGYSINDTVVVYDRIRENLGKHRKMSFVALINHSITEMLRRTLMTSGTTCIAIVPFLAWGTGVIKDFAFTLLVGIVFGTYSSIYIAAPLTEYIDRKLFARLIKKKARVPRRKKKAAGPAELPASA